jgi:hypothetical protein
VLETVVSTPHSLVTIQLMQIYFSNNHEQVPIRGNFVNKITLFITFKTLNEINYFSYWV